MLRYFTKQVGPHKFGCCLCPLPVTVAKQITDWSTENLLDCQLGEGGREFQIHITAKYGLKDDSPQTAAAIRGILTGVGPIPVRLGAMSLFTGGEDGDVLKLEVDSPTLHKLNAEITAAVPCFDKFPEYVPHVTVAYLDPVISQRYVGELPGVSGSVVYLDEVDWYVADGSQRERFDLGLLSLERKAGPGRLVTFDDIRPFQPKALSAIDTTLGGALVPPPAQGRFRPKRLAQSKTLSLLRKGYNPIADLQKAGEFLANHENPAPMPGYGRIFLKEGGSGEVWYVGGDGDEDGFVDLVQQTLSKIQGIDEVTCEAEGFPPKGEGWVEVYPRQRKWDKSLPDFSKTLFILGKATGTCKPGQNPDRDGCTAATDDPKQPRGSKQPEQTKPAEKAEVAEKAPPAQKTGAETTPPASTEEPAEPEVDTSDADFTKEWAATVEQHLAEVEANDVAAHPFSAQEVAAEQNWHKEYIEWRWGLGMGDEAGSNKGKYKPTEADIGAASRFVSGLLNPALGGGSYIASLWDKYIAPQSKTHKPADPAIGEEIQAYFDQMRPTQDNQQLAEVVGEVLGAEAVPIVKAISELPTFEVVNEPLTDEQLMAMTPAERSEAVAAERNARQRPKTELRQAAQAGLTKPAKDENVAKRVALQQRRGVAKGKKRRAETPEQTTAREEKERVALAARRKRQEARVAKYRKQDEREAKKAAKKG